MSVRSFSRFFLACDGEECPSIFGLGDNWSSPQDVRMQAANKGWRFMPTLSVKGDLLLRTTSDVCPDCADGWKPLPAQRGSKAGPLTVAEYRALMERQK